MNGDTGVSKFLVTSTRFRASFQEGAAADALSALKHFGWAPQRRSSKARPLRNFTLRLRHTLSTLARETEDGAIAENKAFARQVVDELGGDESHRLLLAGIMADYRLGALCLGHESRHRQRRCDDDLRRR